MYRILKIVMAEFSYALEKYLGITSILPTIIFTAVIYGMIFSVLLKGIEIIYLKHKKSNKKPVQIFPLYLILAWIVSFLGNILFLNPQTWNSKVYRVMSNFQYVLSFSSNRQAFFDALLIPDNTNNQANIFNIALRLNDAQWATINSEASGSAWYFSKVEKAIKQTLRIGDYHFSINIIDQGWCAYIPCMLLLILSIILFLRTKKIEGIAILLEAFSTIIFCLGGAAFLCIMIYAGYGIWMYFTWVLQKRIERHTQRSGA